MTIEATAAEEQQIDQSPTEQWRMIGRLNVGDPVEIADHDEDYPNARGRISAIELSGESPTVWVYLDCLNDKRAFLPTSCIRKESGDGPDLGINPVRLG